MILKLPPCVSGIFDEWLCLAYETTSLGAWSEGAKFTVLLFLTITFFADDCVAGTFVTRVLSSVLCYVVPMGRFEPFFNCYVFGLYLPFFSGNWARELFYSCHRRSLYINGKYTSHELTSVARSCRGIAGHFMEV